MSNSVPEPDFEARGHTFRAVFKPGERKEMNLTERQEKAVLYVRQQGGQITRRQYERELGVSSRTANRDLNDLVAKGVLSQRGTGPQAAYILASREPTGGGA